MAWFQIVVGAAIAGLWALLLAAGQVPEVDEARIDIWFHVVAELAVAVVLVAGGVALLRRSTHARLLSAFALGALAYSAVNSPGHYAELGDWAMVGMFVVVFTATVAAFMWVCRAGPGRQQHGADGVTLPRREAAPPLRATSDGRRGPRTP